MSETMATCRQCGERFSGAENGDTACRWHPGDYHEGSGLENYEPDGWDCEQRFEACLRTGRHLAMGSVDPGVGPVTFTGRGGELGTFRHATIRIGASARCQVVVGRGDYTYWLLRWEGDELRASGCGSIHHYLHNGRLVDPRTPIVLASGDRLAIELGRERFEATVSFAGPAAP